jgi:hypothetical protein
MASFGPHKHSAERPDIHFMPRTWKTIKLASSQPIPQTWLGRYRGQTRRQESREPLISKNVRSLHWNRKADPAKRWLNSETGPGNNGKEPMNNKQFPRLDIDDPGTDQPNK